MLVRCQATFARLDAVYIGRDQLRLGPVAQHQRHRPGPVMPAQVEHRVASMAERRLPALQWISTPACG